MRRPLVFLLLITLFAGCSKSAPLEPDDLYGLWKFQGYGSHLADQILPDPQQVWNDDKAITLTLEQKGDEISFSGQSAVNAYFGSFRRGGQLPNVAVGYQASALTLGATKKAAPPEEMQREQRYFNGLQQLKSLYLYRQPLNDYDQLLWMVDENAYLSFVRKR